MVYFKTKSTRKKSAPPVQKYTWETQDLKPEAVLLRYLFHKGLYITGVTLSLHQCQTTLMSVAHHCQSPCWNVTLLVTIKWKQSSQWKWKQKIYWAECHSANTWACTAQRILLCLWGQECPLLCWTHREVQHVPQRAPSSKLCGTLSKVILSRFPISSVGNNFLNLRVLGLILMPCFVEF